MQNDILPFLRLRWPEDPCHISLIAILRLWFEWTEPGPFFSTKRSGKYPKKFPFPGRRIFFSCLWQNFWSRWFVSREEYPDRNRKLFQLFHTFYIARLDHKVLLGRIFGSLSYYAERADLQINNIRNFSPKCRWEPSSVFFSVPSLRRLFLAIIMNYLFSSRRLGPSIFSISRRSFRLTNILYYLLPLYTSTIPFPGHERKMMFWASDRKKRLQSLFRRGKHTRVMIPCCPKA